MSAKASVERQHLVRIAVHEGVGASEGAKGALPNGVGAAGQVRHKADARDGRDDPDEDEHDRRGPCRSPQGGGVTILDHDRDDRNVNRRYTR